MNPETLRPDNGRPEYNYLASLEVSPKRPIVINDIMKCQLRSGVSLRDIDRAAKILFASSYKVLPVYFSLEQFFEPTVQLLKKVTTTFDEQTTAVIFPGNGAQPLYEDIWKPIFPFGYKEGNVFTDTEVWVSRKFKNGKPNEITVGLSKGIRDAFEGASFKTIIVVDDVIASGMTLNAIRKRIVYAPYIKYDFVGVSWFCRNPNAVEGYRSINSILSYRSIEGYPALNSLSTLLRTDEKGFAVRDTYKKKSWIKDGGYGYGFDKQIEYIRSLTNIS